MGIEQNSYDWLKHAIRIAYMRGYQKGRRFEKRKAKKLLKKSKGI